MGKFVLFTDSGAGCRTWSDFVLYISNEVHIQWIYFNVDFWNDELLPKLIHFYDYQS